MSPDPDESSTCFKCQRYFRRYLLQSLYRSSSHSKLRVIAHKSSSFWMGVSTLSSCSNQSKHICTVEVAALGTTQLKISKMSQIYQREFRSLQH